MGRLLPGYSYKGFTYALDRQTDRDKGAIWTDEIVDPNGRREWLSWCDNQTYDTRHFDAVVDAGLNEARRRIKSATGHLPMTPADIEAFLIARPVVGMECAA